VGVTDGLGLDPLDARPARQPSRDGTCPGCSRGPPCSRTFFGCCNASSSKRRYCRNCRGYDAERRTAWYWPWYDRTRGSPTSFRECPGGRKPTITPACVFVGLLRIVVYLQPPWKLCLRCRQRGAAPSRSEATGLPSLPSSFEHDGVRKDCEDGRKETWQHRVAEFHWYSWGGNSDAGSPKSGKCKWRHY
jgi:hypothetical protein